MVKLTRCPHCGEEHETDSDEILLSNYNENTKEYEVDFTCLCGESVYVFFSEDEVNT